jgi:type 1 glutamine amidotransferase
MQKGSIAALVGDFYHTAEPMVDALRSAAETVGLALDTFTDPLKAPWDSLGGYRCLVITRENRVAPNESEAVWASARHEKAIAAFVRSGGAFLGLHAGLASYGFEGEYFETTRGGFLFHPREHPAFQVRPLPGGHPITDGSGPLELKDEMYFVRVDSARTTRLMETTSPDFGSSTAAWAHTLGKGRVFCLTPGHNPEVLSNPGYRRLLENGMRWAVNME